MKEYCPESTPTSSSLGRQQLSLYKWMKKRKKRSPKKKVTSSFPNNYGPISKLIKLQKIRTKTESIRCP